MSVTFLFGLKSMERNEFVLVGGKTEGKECVWVRRALQICISTVSYRREMEMSLLQYLDVVQPLHKVYEALRSLRS